jgi:hypothetical protein
MALLDEYITNYVYEYKEIRMGIGFKILIRLRDCFAELYKSVPCRLMIGKRLYKYGDVIYFSVSTKTL